MSITWGPPRRLYTLIPAHPYPPRLPHDALTPPPVPSPWGSPRGSAHYLVKEASAKIASPTCCTKRSERPADMRPPLDPSSAALTLHPPPLHPVAPRHHLKGTVTGTGATSPIKWGVFSCSCARQSRTNCWSCCARRGCRTRSSTPTEDLPLKPLHGPKTAPHLTQDSGKSTANPSPLSDCPEKWPKSRNMAPVLSLWSRESFSTQIYRYSTHGRAGEEDGLTHWRPPPRP